MTQDEINALLKQMKKQLPKQEASSAPSTEDDKQESEKADDSTESEAAESEDSPEGQSSEENAGSDSPSVSGEEQMDHAPSAAELGIDEKLPNSEESFYSYLAQHEISFEELGNDIKSESYIDASAAIKQLMFALMDDPREELSNAAGEAINHMDELEDSAPCSPIAQKLTRNVYASLSRIRVMVSDSDDLASVVAKARRWFRPRPQITANRLAHLDMRGTVTLRSLRESILIALAEGSLDWRSWRYHYLRFVDYLVPANVIAPSIHIAFNNATSTGTMIYLAKSEVGDAPTWHRSDFCCSEMDPKRNNKQ